MYEIALTSIPEERLRACTTSKDVTVYIRQRKILQHYQKPTQDEDESKEKFKKEKKTRRPIRTFKKV